VEKHLEDMLVVILLVFERPPRLENEPVFLGRDRELAVGIEFKRGISGGDLTEEKKGLLGRYLIGERDRLGKRNVDMPLGREQGIKQLGIVLEESLFDRPCSLGQEGEREEERE
jgi:hypothetical protein